MKLLLLFILLFSFSPGHSQDRYEKDRKYREMILEECNCPDQIFHTDSVYSFFRSSPFKPFNKGEVIFEVQDEPLSYDTIQKKIIETFMLSSLSLHFVQHAPYRKSEEMIIVPVTLRKMLSAVIDSTTRYTEPVIRWNAARLGEEWITASNSAYLIEFTNKRMKQADNEKFQKHEMDLNRMRRYYRIQMSVPVFDWKYQYAFLIFKMDEDYSYALFERQDNEWQPIRVSKDKNNTRIWKDFRYYQSMVRWW